MSEMCACVCVYARASQSGNVDEIQSKSIHNTLHSPSPQLSPLNLGLGIIILTLHPSGGCNLLDLLLRFLVSESRTRIFPPFLFLFLSKLLVRLMCGCVALLSPVQHQRALNSAVDVIPYDPHATPHLPWKATEVKRKTFC